MSICGASSAFTHLHSGGSEGFLTSLRAHGSLSMLPFSLHPTPESGSVAMALFPFLPIAQKIRPVRNRQPPSLSEPPLFSLEGEAVLGSPLNLFYSELRRHLPDVIERLLCARHTAMNGAPG